MLSREEINKLFPEFKKIQKNAKGKEGKFTFSEEDYKYIISGPAYSAMQPRLLEGISGKVKTKLWEKLSKMFADYFNSSEPPRTKEEFDEKHYEICYFVEDYFKRDPGSNPEGGLGFKNYKYGQAQKLVNMSFKYFYCFEDATKKEKYFRFCHMPIDSYILEWCKRQKIKIEINGKKYLPEKWSKMSKDEYIALENAIKERISQCNEYSGLTLLEAEFYIWPEEKIIKAAKELINIKESIQCVDILKASLPKEKINEVNKILSSI